MVYNASYFATRAKYVECLWIWEKGWHPSLQSEYYLQDAVSFVTIELFCLASLHR